MAGETLNEDIDELHIEEENEIYDEIYEETIMDKNPRLNRIKSPLKWAGGKFRILDNICKYIPKETTRFLEPFFGGGSVGLNIDCEEIVINDSNDLLVGFWQSIQTNSTVFIEEISKIFIDENNTLQKFSQYRDEFNNIEDTFRRSVLFLYLNKHCFNGLCRFNSKGGFNVPFGKYKSVTAPIKEIKEVSRRIKSYSIMNKDFRDVFKLVEKNCENTVIYCDPPYVALSDTANFSDYGKEGFSIKDQKELVNLAIEASEKGARVIISNHYNKVTQELYKDAKRRKVFYVSRFISSDGENRKPVREVLAIYDKNYVPNKRFK